jgi:hypothetical protein
MNAQSRIVIPAGIDRPVRARSESGLHGWLLAYHPWHGIRQLLLRCSTSCIRAVDPLPGGDDELTVNTKR